MKNTKFFTLIFLGICLCVLPTPAALPVVGYSAGSSTFLVGLSNHVEVGSYLDGGFSKQLEQYQIAGWYSR